jgi:hypothetical protein
VLAASDDGIVGSNPIGAMDACIRLSVLSCPVSVEVLQLVETQFKAFCQISRKF